MRLPWHTFPALFLLVFLAACGSNNGSVQVNATSFDFGNVAIGTQVRRIAVTVTNSTAANVNASPTLSGSSDFTLAQDVSCNGSLQNSGGCSVVVVFTPSSAQQQTAQLDLGLSDNNQTISITGTGVQLSPGQSIVTSTDNPLVARYTYAPASSGNVSVEFGPDTNYVFRTAPLSASAGTPVSFLVAGMRANSEYHMRAIVDGGETDADQTFSTTNFPDATLPSLTVSSSGTPQPGIELMNPALSKASASFLQAYAVDLEGNLIWGYDYPDRTKDTILQSFHLLPNGDVAVLIGLNSTVKGAPGAGSPIVLREVDLSGVPVRQVTLDQVNSGLNGLTLVDLHHDVTVLPNGHWIVLGNAFKSYSSLPNQSGDTNVLGDVVVDLDTSLNPVWTWSEFDTLDINRAPDGYPDWTHSNALLYVPGDGNLLVSSRHQNWIMKLDYRNGAGNGAILWRLGKDGDFTLVNGSAPQDWFYGQHQMAFVGSNTTGNFQLSMMDNGFNRQLASGQCTGSSCYTTVPIYQIDESAKTATVIWRDTIDASKFSIWGGGTTPLAKGHLEYDLCAVGDNSEIDEVTVTSSPQVVWSLQTTGQNLYRANRAPSLYPGVQW